MNIMILSPGRRVEVVEFFKDEFLKIGGKVFTVDMSSYAPALYIGDEFFIVKKDFENLENYINEVIKICCKKNIKAVITFIDPELVLLAKYRKKFIENGIEVILSSDEIIGNSFDKFEFYKKYKNKLPLVKTYSSVFEVKEAMKNKEIELPLFHKKITGSGSDGIGKINSIEELDLFMEQENFIFQPYSKVKEFGVDVYFDMIDGKIKKYFIKEKLSMRAGETDKSISVKRKDISELVKKLESISGLRGPVDIDIFEDKNGNLYINEINPRFGGGYVHAHKSGVNFIPLIINNLKNIINDKIEEDYKEDILMMKYAGSIIK